MSSQMFILVILFFVSSALAEFPSLRCPPFNPPFGRFDVADYVGVWYEIARTNPIFETGLDCVNATYSLGKNGDLAIVNEGVYLKTGLHSKVSGTGRRTTQSNLFEVDIFPLLPKAPYYIADTALVYQGASIVVSCLNTPLFPLRAGYILSRKKEMDNITKTLLAEILIGLGFNQKDIRYTEQKKCP